MPEFLFDVLFELHTIFLRSYIESPVKLIDVRLVAVLAWDFLNSVVNLRVRVG